MADQSPHALPAADLHSVEPILPCPFCAAALEPFGPAQHNHPRNECWLSSVAIKASEYTSWNRRASPATLAPSHDEPSILAVGVHHTTFATTVAIRLHQGDRITTLYAQDHPAGRETMGTVRLSPEALATTQMTTAADRFARARYALQQGIDRCAVVTATAAATTESSKE